MRNLLFGTSLIALACVTIAWTNSNADEPTGDDHSKSLPISGLAIVKLKPLPRKAGNDPNDAFPDYDVRADKDGNWQGHFEIVHLFRKPMTAEHMRHIEDSTIKFDEVVITMGTSRWNKGRPELDAAKYTDDYFLMEMTIIDDKLVGGDMWAMPTLPKWKETSTPK